MTSNIHITWQDILDWKEITDDSLVSFLKDGLQPYNRDGLEVGCPYEFHEYSHQFWRYEKLSSYIDELTKIIDREKELEQSGTIYLENTQELRELFSDFTFLELQADFELQVELIPISPKDMEILKEARTMYVETGQRVAEQLIEIEKDEPNLQGDNKSLSWKYFNTPVCDLDIPKQVKMLHSLYDSLRKECIFRLKDVDKMIYGNDDFDTFQKRKLELLVKKPQRRFLKGESTVMDVTESERKEITKEYEHRELEHINKFSDLNFEQLQRYAKRWVDKYSEVPIERITLYHYYSKYQEHYDFLNNERMPIKYAVIFDIADTVHSKLESTGQEYCPLTPDGGTFNATEVIKKLDNSQFDDFLFALDESHLDNPIRYLAFMDEAFPVVYKHQPVKHDWQKDWTFIYKKKPERGLSANVMTNEPYWVLYDVEEELAFNLECRLQKSKERNDKEKRIKKSAGGIKTLKGRRDSDVSLPPIIPSEVSPNRTPSDIRTSHTRFPAGGDLNETPLVEWKEIARVAGWSVSTAKRRREELMKEKVIWYEKIGRQKNKRVKAYPSTLKNYVASRQK